MQKRPTDSELEILQVLWRRGPSSVREVNEVLNTKREIGYTTTLKIMQIMTEKGFLSRKKDGKTHIYQAAASKESTQNLLLDRFVETTFGGSAMNLVMQALGNSKTTPEQLNEIREYLDQIEGGNDHE